MNTAAIQEISDALNSIENTIQDQLDRIYDIAKRGVDPSFMKVEYRRAVDLIAQKYELLHLSLDKQKDLLDENVYAQKKTSLDEQYTDDIVLLAAAIDEAIESK